jgi:RNA polymerase sigma factor (sigma-70 family)
MRAASASAAFPPTHLSVVRQARSGDPEARARAVETIAAAYWRPVYAHVRLSHRAEPADAEDLVQGFFAEALRRELFARYEPERARFRTFLRACVDAFVANERKAERRLKRGGGARAVPLDLAELEGRLASDGRDPERAFDRSVLAIALERLRERCERAGKRTHLALFERYDIAGAEGEAPPTYAALAAELGITTTQATNWLAAVRRDFRAAVLETLRDLTGNDDELRAETRALLGVELP